MPGPPHDDGQRRRADEGPRAAARGAGQGAHRARRRRTSWSSASPRTRARSPRSSSASASPARCTSSPASPPSASSSSTPRPRSRSCRRCTRASRCPPSRRWRAACPLVATTGGALPEVVGHRRRDRPARCRRATPTRSPPRSLRALGDADAAGPHRRAPAARGCSTRFTWRADRGRHGRELPRAARRAQRADGRAPDAHRRLRPARPARRAAACSTWAAAAGATRSRRCGAARPSSRSTTTRPSSRTCAASCGAMIEAGEIPPTRRGGAVNGDALRLPFPDATFDRIIASEVLEHLWDDERGDRRAGARAASRRPHRGHRARPRFPERVSWALDYRLPRHARRARAHLPAARARGEARAARASGCAARTTRTRCTRRTGGSSARSASTTPTRGRCAATTTSSCSRSSGSPRWVAALDRTLNPVLGQEPGRLHPEGRLMTRAHDLLPDRRGHRHRDAARRRPSTRSRRSSSPTATSRGRPGGHTDPWNLVEAAMALDLGGRHDEAARRVRAGCAGKQRARRRLARLLPRRRRRGPDARHQRHLLRRHRRLAPPPRHRRHRLPRASCGRRSRPPSTSRSTSRRETGEIAWRGDDPDDGALLTGSSSIHHSLRARSPSPSGSATSDPTGSSRSVRSPSPSPTGPTCSSTRTAGRWTGTTRSSAACCAATPAHARVAARLGDVRRRRAAASAACRTARGSPRPRRASW